jgi:hypothetical protein
MSTVEKVLEHTWGEFRRRGLGTSDATTWADQVQYKGGIGKSMRTVRRFLRAVQTGRVKTEYWPELRDCFRPEWTPHVTMELAQIIDDAILNQPGTSRQSYSRELVAASKGLRGPEHPCGWVPFFCTFGGQRRTLMTGMCPFPDPGDDRVVFATLGEILDLATDGPEDELDRLVD